MQYKILKHEVTGVKGTRYFRGQVINADSLIESSIDTLIATKAIVEYTAPEKPAKPAKDDVPTSPYAKLKSADLVKLLEEREIDFASANTNADKVVLLDKFDSDKAASEDAGNTGNA